MAKVIERLEALYEVLDAELGKVYRWCPESVVVECECGKTPTLPVSKASCGDCGTDHQDVAEEVLEARPGGDDEEETGHPWRSLRPYYAPTRGT